MGYGAQKKTGYALDLDDQLIVDFMMEVDAAEIKVAEVVANSLKNTIKTLGSSTPITAQEIKKSQAAGSCICYSNGFF